MYIYMQLWKITIMGKSSAVERLFHPYICRFVKSTSTPSSTLVGSFGHLSQVLHVWYI
jgi:hypothetical protein